MDIKTKHERFMYPMVRVFADGHQGSGTIIFSEKEPTGEGHETYVLTNHHVVGDLIKFDKTWDDVLGRKVDVARTGTPIVESFTYEYLSRAVGGTTLQTDIVAYDREEDLALLKLRTSARMENVATLFPKDRLNELAVFQSVVTVGCGMGNKPVPTFGYIGGFGYEYKNKHYMLITAPSVFGNSGGASFLEETGEMIGVPALITVNWIDVITHLSYSISIERIYDFLDAKLYQFIYDNSYSSAQCARLREEKRDADRNLRRFKLEKGADDEVSPAGFPGLNAAIAAGTLTESQKRDAIEQVLMEQLDTKNWPR